MARNVTAIANSLMQTAAAPPPVYADPAGSAEQIAGGVDQDGNWAIPLGQTVAGRAARGETVETAATADAARRSEIERDRANASTALREQFSRLFNPTSLGSRAGDYYERNWNKINASRVDARTAAVQSLDPALRASPLANMMANAVDKQAQTGYASLAQTAGEANTDYMTGANTELANRLARLSKTDDVWGEFNQGARSLDIFANNEGPVPDTYNDFTGFTSPERPISAGVKPGQDMMNPLGDTISGRIYEPGGTLGRPKPNSRTIT